MRDSQSKRGTNRIRQRRWLALRIVILTSMTIAGCGASSRPDPLSDAIVEARSDRTQEMRVALDEVAKVFDGQVLGQSSVDECYEGQRNWKVDTGYDYRCSVLLGVLIGLDGDFRSQMLDTDVALEELGWRSQSGEWPGQLVDDYWDLRAGESPDGRVRLDRLPSPNTVLRDDLRLLFDYGGAVDDQGIDRIDRGQQRTSWCCGQPFYEQRELMEVDRAIEAHPHGHLVLVTVEGHYASR